MGEVSDWVDAEIAGICSELGASIFARAGVALILLEADFCEDADAWVRPMALLSIVSPCASLALEESWTPLAFLSTVFVSIDWT